MEDELINQVEDMPEEGSTSLRVKAYRILLYLAKQIKTGKCSEEDIAEIISLSTPERLGYIREEDYVTADEGMRLLGLGNNRSQFFALIKQYGIEANTFNNVKIGYKRNDIIKMRVALSEDKDNFILKKKRKKTPLSEKLED